MRDKIRAQQYDAGPVVSWLISSVTIAAAVSLLVSLVSKCGASGLVVAGLAVVGAAGWARG